MLYIAYYLSSRMIILCNNIVVMSIFIVLFLRRLISFLYHAETKENLYNFLTTSPLTVALDKWYFVK